LGLGVCLLNGKGLQFLLDIKGGERKTHLAIFFAAL